MRSAFFVTDTKKSPSTTQGTSLSMLSSSSTYSPVQTPGLQPGRVGDWVGLEVGASVLIVGVCVGDWEGADVETVGFMVGVSDGESVGDFVGVCVVSVGDIDGAEVVTVGDEVVMVGDEVEVDGELVGVKLGD